MLYKKAQSIGGWHSIGQYNEIGVIICPLVKITTLYKKLVCIMC